MYKWLKEFVKLLVPKPLLYQYELSLRKIYAQIFFRGNECACNLCESHFSNFITLPTGDLLCPVCGSLPRNRRLWQILTEELKISGRILHFSPSRVLYRKLKERQDLDYISTDFEEEFIADYWVDITNIDFPDQTFDYIICFHILEHISEDKQAMWELFRILKPGGMVLIQTPFQEGEIYEDANITSEADRLHHFGQRDHVRIYSAKGLTQRLVDSGFQVEIRQFEMTEKAMKYGLKPAEIVLFSQRMR